ITTRCRRRALCSSAISSGVAISGVYTRPEKYGNRAGSPWMWVWQSQAPAGTSKLTRVAGWDAFARPPFAWISNPPASAPATNPRLVGMACLLSDTSALARFRPGGEFARARNALVGVPRGKLGGVEPHLKRLFVRGEPLHRKLAVVAVEPDRHQTPVSLLVV